MTATPASPSAPPPAREPTGVLGRIAAVAEVVAAFALLHLGYRSFKHFTGLGRQEVDAGLNFSPGAAMILFTAAALLLGRRRCADYGLTSAGWRYHLNVGVLWSVVMVVAAGVLIRAAALHYDPLRPPDTKRAAIFAVAELVNALLLLLLLRRDRGWLRRVPAAVGLFALLVLLAVPPALALAGGRPVVPVLLAVLWLFFGAGFGEEVFFRGYVQSRVDEALGRPCRLLGAEFGWGLAVSAALFGLIHVLNPVDYFAGRYDFAWQWWLPAFAGGLFFGLLRARTGSVLPGAVIHGLTDVLAMVPGLLP
jgi:membrane protease YdiL (CAAX protease family)